MKLSNGWLSFTTNDKSQAIDSLFATHKQTLKYTRKEGKKRRIAHRNWRVSLIHTH